MVNLNENNNSDVKKFYQQLNVMVKYRTKGKIVKGVKIEDSIIYGKKKIESLKHTTNNYFIQEKYIQK